jgi:ABC-2 type transport system ATP-binding protein
MTNSNNIIETFDLTKIYKLRGSKNVVTALNKVNLSIKEGEIFGLLGPNGAGKTTMVSILTTLIMPTSGYATIDGINILKKPRLAKSKVALMLESSMLYYRITGYDNLKFFSNIYLVKNYEEKIKELTEVMGLEKWLGQYVENYSSGMKMQLALCKTLLLDREILFLDEPTLGLDVRSSSIIVNRLKNINKTIFLTSHNMDIVEQLCDRIAFIDNGNILKIGYKEDLKRFMKSEIQIEIEIIKDKEKLKSEFENYKFIGEIIETKVGLEIILKHREKYRDLLKILGNYDVLRIKEKELSLGDLFLKII